MPNIDTASVVMAHEFTVFRSPTCGCCGKWMNYIKAAGLTVDDRIMEDVDHVKQQYGLPSSLASCHTAIVDGYIIEGHVPLEDIQRLLDEKLAIAGLSAPGMPMGSPGMESGGEVDPYTVFAFTTDNRIAPFASHF